METLTLIRDAKFTTATKPGFFGGLYKPDGSKLIDTMDPGGVIEQTTTVSWQISPHLSLVVNTRTRKETTMDEILDAIKGDNPNNLTIISAYRLKDAKLAGGAVSENILFHGGRFVEDSLDCFLTGLGRAWSYNPRTNLNEPDLVASIDAKNKMTQYLTPAGTNHPADFTLVIKNAPGLVV
jgi:hypothetical protein